MTAQGEFTAPAQVAASASQAPQTTRIRPLDALRALVRLGRDPQDTRQVFIAEAALRGKSGVRLFERFASTPAGAAVLADRRKLMDTLDDHAALASLPPGSLGRVYLDFMQSENLSAAGLMEISDDEDLGLGADGRLFRDRVRDMHDLNHVVTGYGRDVPGELCLLAFLFRQTRNRVYIVIVLASVIAFIRARSTGKLPPGGAVVGKGMAPKVGKAVLEALSNGKKGAWQPGLDWEALLSENLEDLRRRLGVPTPRAYLALKA